MHLGAILDEISYWALDAVLFPTLQVALVLLVIYSVVRSRWMISGGELSAQVNRSSASMAVFYGAYAAISGVATALCLNVDMAANYRVLFVILDLVLIAYLCLGSNWFRNKLIGWADSLTKLERR